MERGPVVKEAPTPVTVRTRLRVRYPETDHMGVVHHTHYLTWFEVGRTELMRQRGRTYADMEKEGIFMPVAEAECRYLAPARYDEEIEIETRVAAVSRIRVEFVYSATRVADGRLLASGRTLHVATTPAGVPRRMPQEHVDALAGDGGLPPRRARR
jgi:acyl-CoA thioester hydrolase